MTIGKDYEIIINGEKVMVDFFFTKGYPASEFDPGCYDEIDIASVKYKGTEVYKLLHKDTINCIIDQLFAGKPQDY